MYVMNSPLLERLGITYSPVEGEEFLRPDVTRAEAVAAASAAGVVTKSDGLGGLLLLEDGDAIVVDWRWTPADFASAFVAAEMLADRLIDRPSVLPELAPISAAAVLDYGCLQSPEFQAESVKSLVATAATLLLDRLPEAGQAESLYALTAAYDNGPSVVDMARSILKL